VAPYDSNILHVGPVSVVDVFWAEISDSIGTVEQLHEDKKFSDSDLAALVASKVYYHLGSYDDALEYALEAGEKFDITEKSEYVDTMIGKGRLRLSSILIVINCILTFSLQPSASTRTAPSATPRWAAARARTPPLPPQERSPPPWSPL
jgi:hypothetical protein